MMKLSFEINTLFLLLSIHQRQFFSFHYFFSQHNISLAMAFLSQFAPNPALIKFLNWFNCQFRSSILAIFCPVHMLSNEHMCNLFPLQKICTFATSSTFAFVTSHLKIFLLQEAAKKQSSAESEVKVFRDYL